LTAGLGNNWVGHVNAPVFRGRLTVWGDECEEKNAEIRKGPAFPRRLVRTRRGKKKERSPRGTGYVFNAGDIQKR